MTSASSVAALLFAMLSVQLGASLAKKLFVVLGAEVTCGLRVLLAALVLLAFFRPWREFSKLTKKQILFLAIYGFSLGAMNLSFYLALVHIPLGVTVALEFSGPLAVAIFSSRRKLDLLWAASALLGIFLLFPPLHFGAWKGPLLALTAGFFWALYILFGQKASQNLRSTTAVSFGMAIAALTVLPFTFSPSWLPLQSSSLWLLALAVALLSSALPYSLEMMALKKVPLQTFGILMSLEPVVAALVGFLFLHERLALMQILAMIFIVAASLGSALTQRKPVTEIYF